MSATFDPLKQSFENDMANAGSILSFAAKGRYMTGARCKLMVNGKIVAFAFSITWNIRTEQEEILVIDEFLPYEYAPRRLYVDGTISGFRVPDDGPGNRQIQSTPLSFLFHKYVTIEVRDWRTDTLLFRTNKAVFTSSSEEHKGAELSSISLQWKAIGFEDNYEAKMPIDPNS